MNPYLERNWRGVHVILLGEIIQALARELPDDLYVRAEEQLKVESRFPDNTHESSRVADVAITEKWRKGVSPTWPPDQGKAGGGTALMAKPEVIFLSERPERWLEIRNIKGELVTVIEVPSPSNKRGKDRDAYLDKTHSLRQCEVNLVEIDLLRSGLPTAGMAHDDIVPGDAGGIFVFRAREPHCMELYRCPLRQRLPIFPVPLREQDAEVPLDLQPMINHIYETGRYWLQDGEYPLAPSLSAEDEAWAKECLARSGEAK